MKIYFTTSARGNTDTYNNSLSIYQSIRKLGHEHLDDFFEDMNETKVYSDSYEEKKKRYLDAIKHIRDAEIIILEVSTHSLSMGYLLKMSLESGKPVILLYTSNQAPAFAEGIENDKLQIWEYTSKDLLETLNEAIKIAKEESDLRFNFFISPKQYEYLHEKSKLTKLSKSAIIRMLIDESIKKDLSLSYKIE